MKWFKAILFSIFVISASVYADTVNMAFGEKIPPFVFPKTDSGIEVEVIREALAFKGHTLKASYYPLSRVPLIFKQLKKIDAAMTSLGLDINSLGGVYGEPAVIYDNVFITLKSSKIKIEKPSDLRKLSVISFQGAMKRYPKWLGSKAQTSRYRESSSQDSQVKLLIRKRVDVVLSDRNIFKYYLKKYSEGLKINSPEVTEHHFVELNILDYRPIFKSKKIRDDFNEGLKHIKESGLFNKIYEKYIGREEKLQNLELVPISN